MTVNSVEQMARTLGRTTVVFSVYPTAAVTWIASSNFPAAAASTVMSIAPLGRLAGTVTVPFSGAQVRFELQAVKAATAGAGFVATGLYAYYRLVDANSLNITGDSAWAYYQRVGNMETPLYFTAVASLGAGSYTVELQQRLSYDVSNASSRWSISVPHGIALWATTQAR